MSQVIDPVEAERRFQRYSELFELNMTLAEAGVKHDYPDATPQQVRQILAERFAIIRKDKWKGYGPHSTKT